LGILYCITYAGGMYFTKNYFSEPIQISAKTDELPFSKIAVVPSVFPHFYYFSEKRHASWYLFEILNLQKGLPQEIIADGIDEDTVFMVLLEDCNQYNSNSIVRTLSENGFVPESFFPLTYPFSNYFYCVVLMVPS
jgi:hypothetical protein